MTQKVGIIAGSGQFPILFAKAAMLNGLQVFAVGYHGETDPQLEQYVSQLEWLYLGQLKKLIKFFHKNGVEQAVMLGAITKTRMFTDVRPDIKAIALIAAMRHTHDDALLRAFASALEKEGIRIQPSTMLLPELLAPPGIWTKKAPNKAQWEDIRLGWKIAKEIGRLDIGQCVVVGGGSVLAVEAMEGTDAAIMRGGSLSKGTAVVTKVCKPNQDTRFDVPAIGLGTIQTMVKAGVDVLAVEADKALVFDRDNLILEADKNNISIVAIDEGTIEIPNG